MRSRKRSKLKINIQCYELVHTITIEFEVRLISIRGEK